jgi:glycosyltransferase involved in cell wall biosynthesis
MMWPSLTVVVFAYNEAENVGATMREAAAWLRGHVADWELIVVDDGSSDGTADAARNAMQDAFAGDEERVRVLSYRGNRGIGGALKTGFAAASRRWVTMVPADGQIAPAELSHLLRAAERDPAIGLVTCHFPDRFEQADGIDRKILSEGLKAVMWASTGVRRRFDGVYLFQTSLFKSVELKSESFFFNFELPIRLLRAGVVAAETTIAVRPRMAGQSKVKNLKTISRVARELVKLGLELRLGIGA